MKPFMVMGLAAAAAVMVCGGRQANAQCVWPDGAGAFSAGDVLTHDALNTRFEAVQSCMQAIPANVGDIANLDALIRERVQAEVAAAVANLEFTADSVVDAAACDGAGGTTVTFRQGEMQLSQVLVCNGARGDRGAPGGEPELPAGCMQGQALVFQDGAWVCGEVDPGVGAVEARVEQAEQRFVGNEPLRVCHQGCEFSLLSEALEFLRGRRIAADGSLTITIDASDIEYLEPAIIDLAHPDGTQVRVECGELNDTRDTTISFAGDGLRAVLGGGLGFIGGCTLKSRGEGSTGIRANDGAVVGLGNLRFERFGTWSLHATRGGMIVRTEVDGAFEIVGEEERKIGGVIATEGGSVFVNGAMVWYAATQAFRAEFGGVIVATGSAANDATLAAYFAQVGGVVVANDAVSRRSSTGFRADLGATLSAVRGRAEESRASGFFADGGGVVASDFAMAIASRAHGFSATNGGVVVAAESLAEGSSASGYLAHGNSSIFAPGASASENGQHALSAATAGYISAVGLECNRNGNGQLLGVRAEGLGLIRRDGLNDADCPLDGDLHLGNAPPLPGYIQ